MSLLVPWGRHPGRYTGTVTFGEPGPLADGSTCPAFDGYSGAVYVPWMVSLSAFTVECWAYQTSTSSGNPRALSNGHPDITQNGLELVINGNFGSGTKAYSCAIGNGTAHTTILTDTILDLNTWYYCAMTYDSTTSLTLWLNAAALASVTPIGTITAKRGIGIAYDPSYDGDFFPGRLAWVAIYPTALSQARQQARIAAASQSQRGAYRAVVLQDRPLAVWPLTDPSGPWAHDAVLWAA